MIFCYSNLNQKFSQSLEIWNGLVWKSSSIGSKAMRRTAVGNHFQMGSKFSDQTRFWVGVHPS